MEAGRMTLKNARRRFESLGWEVERDLARYRYKARAVGSLRWVRHFYLESLLLVAERDAPKP